jgi:hypothetical protein
LQARGLISYSRGKLVILDGKGLELASCGCYQQDNDVYEQTLGQHPRSSAHGAHQ